MKQAETQKASTDGAVTARLPEAYQWLLVPVQSSPQAAVAWQSFRLSGQDALAVRAGKKLRHDELLVTSLAGTRLKMELDRVPLWRGDHVAIKQLTEHFACYLYLPRLKEPEVLLGAIRDGLALLTWERESFAYAESYDDMPVVPLPQKGSITKSALCDEQRTILSSSSSGFWVGCFPSSFSAFGAPMRQWLGNEPWVVPLAFLECRVRSNRSHWLNTNTRPLNDHLKARTRICPGNDLAIQTKPAHRRP